MWDKIVIVVCLGVILVACATTGTNMPTDPSAWDCIGDENSPACLENAEGRRANTFEAFWEKAEEDGGVWVMAKGHATVACAHGEFSSFAAMSKCKFDLDCYYQGVEHTIELFYPGGGLFRSSGNDDDRVCAKCVCTRPPPKR
jgi:hypothetical protein